MKLNAETFANLLWVATRIRHGGSQMPILNAVRLSSIDGKLEIYDTELTDLDFMICVEEVAKDYSGRLSVAKVNVDDHPTLAMKYGVRGIPTLLIFKQGQVASQIVGYLPKAALAQKVDDALGA